MDICTLMEKFNEMHKEHTELVAAHADVAAKKKAATSKEDMSYFAFRLARIAYAEASIASNLATLAASDVAVNHGVRVCICNFAIAQADLAHLHATASALEATGSMTGLRAKLVLCAATEASACQLLQLAATIDFTHMAVLEAASNADSAQQTAAKARTNATALLTV